MKIPNEHKALVCRLNFSLYNRFAQILHKIIDATAKQGNKIPFSNGRANFVAKRSKHVDEKLAIPPKEP